MTPAHETIARRAAARFAPRIDPRLPIFVELSLAAEDGTAKPPDQLADTATVLAAASLLLSAVKMVLDEYRAYRAEREKQAQGEPLTAAETAQLRELLARRARHLPFSSDMSSEARDALVDVTVDETLAEVKQLEAKR